MVRDAPAPPRTETVVRLTGGYHGMAEPMTLQTGIRQTSRDPGEQSKLLLCLLMGWQVAKFVCVHPK